MADKPDRIKYDPAQPRSFCMKCRKLDWTRKRGSQWLCASCTLDATKREAALLKAKAELAADRGSA